jgi:thiol-disulfide isomerase/thioredoxin
LKTQRVVVVLFLSTVCPYAQYFGDHIGQLAERYRPAGVSFVAVNSNQYESADETAEFGRAHGYRFALISDADASIADRLGARCSPEAFVVDHEGRLRYRGWVQSRLRSPDLQRALEAILGGRTVRLSSTKAFGCAIDRARAPSHR